ncbi:UNVERIFIED_CONTAM: hypothetical protein Sindi_1850900 [Sesamum indicum]
MDSQISLYNPTHTKTPQQTHTHSPRKAGDGGSVPADEEDIGDEGGSHEEGSREGFLGKNARSCENSLTIAVVGGFENPKSVGFGGADGEEAMHRVNEGESDVQIGEADMAMRLAIGADENMDNRTLKSKAAIVGHEGPSMAENNKPNDTLQRVKDFNMREFLHLAHRVIDEGDEAAIAALDELKKRWESKIGRVPVPTENTPSAAHPLTHLQQIPVPVTDLMEMMPELNPESVLSKLLKQSDLLQISLMATEGSESMENLGGNSLKQVEDDCTKVTTNIAGSSLPEFGAKNQQDAAPNPPMSLPTIGRNAELISSPNISSRTMGGDAHGTGIFIGTIPLHSVNPHDIFTDKIADAYNNSSRRTLKFIEPCMQNGEVVIRPSLTMPAVKDVIATSNGFTFFDFTLWRRWKKSLREVPSYSRAN